MIIDAAVYLGCWPFRPIEGTVGRLSRLMRASRVTHALVSQFESFFHTDPASANERLLKTLEGKRSLWAAPAINVRMPHWEHHLTALAEHPQVRAVRLAPGFHGYPVADARPVILRAAELGRAAIVQVRFQDERHHPPVSNMQPAPMDDVVALAAACPRARVVASGARLRDMVDQAEHIQQLRNLWMDISHLDGLACVKEACAAVGAKRLVFSTCWPFFYARSGFLKVEEAEIPARDREGIMGRNAEHVLAPR